MILSTNKKTITIWITLFLITLALVLGYLQLDRGTSGTRLSDSAIRELHENEFPEDLLLIPDQAEVYCYRAWQAGDAVNKAVISVVARNSKMDDGFYSHSISDIEVVIKGGDGKLVRRKIPQCDPLADTWVTDLDADGKIEIILWLSSAGTGVYGSIMMYQWDGSHFQDFKFPPLSTDDARDYSGHDKFWIKNNTLMRQFPLYYHADSNSDPTNGVRQISYTWKNGTWQSVSDDLLLEKVKGVVRRVKRELK